MNRKEIDEIVKQAEQQLPQAQTGAGGEPVSIDREHLRAYAKTTADIIEDHEGPAHGLTPEEKKARRDKILAILMKLLPVVIGAFGAQTAPEGA